MKKLFILIAILYTGVTFAQEMKIHMKDGVIDSYPLSQIDSITFSVASIPTEGLVAYFPFNGNTNDESGNGYNGTNNGAILTTDRFGNPNSAFNFNGSSNIVVPNTENLNFTSGGFTLATWVNFNSTIIDNGLLSKHIWGVSGYLLNIYENKLSFYLDGPPRLTSDGNYNDGNWHFLVGVFDGTTQFLYIDGILMKTQTGVNMTANNAQIIIGSATGGGYFIGSLDDILIYNRALTNQEITTIYNSK